MTYDTKSFHIDCLINHLPFPACLLQPGKRGGGYTELSGGYFDEWSIDLCSSEKVPLSIPARTFQNTSIVSITIPATLESIGEKAFVGSSLETIYIKGTADDAVALLSSGTFPDCLGAIYVDDDMVDKYKENWSSLADKIKPISEASI